MESNPSFWPDSRAPMIDSLSPHFLSQPGLRKTELVPSFEWRAGEGAWNTCPAAAPSMGVAGEITRPFTAAVILFRSLAWCRRFRGPAQNLRFRQGFPTKPSGSGFAGRGGGGKRQKDRGMRGACAMQTQRRSTAKRLRGRWAIGPNACANGPWIDFTRVGGHDDTRPKAKLSGLIVPALTLRQA